MAPSNLNQVFFANSATLLDDAEAFNTTAVAGSSKIGVWNLAANAFIDNAAPVDIMTLNNVQIVQTMPSGNPIASPVINTKNIKRIKYTRNAASQRHQVVATFSPAVPAGQTYMVKIALRTAPTAYAGYDQLTPTALDLSNAGIPFPLEGNFSAGRTIMPVVEIAAGSSVAQCGAAVTTAISNTSSMLSKLFTASDNGSGQVTILARHAGVVFDLVAFNTVTDTNVIGNPTVTGFDAGVGNYWQALSDEKSQRSRYGNFNRMYFPMAFDQFAVSNRAYDVLEIQYQHGHPSSTGIARAGELNTIKIYILDVANAGTAAGSIFVAGAGTWGLGDVERLF